MSRPSVDGAFEIRAEPGVTGEPLGEPPRQTRILHGRLGPAVFLFGLPLALGMGLQTAFNLVDAYVIARLGPEVAGAALGAIGLVDQLAAVGTIVAYGISTASAAVLAEAHGRGDHAEVRRVAWQSSLAIGALSLAFGLVSLLAAGPVVRDLVGFKGQVADLAVQYLRVSGAGSFSIFFLLHLTAIQRALGSSKTPALLLVLANVLNLVLAVLLVYGPGPAPAVFAWAPPLAAKLHLPRMELVGAAWATIAARAVTLVPLVWLLARARVFSDLPSRRPDRAEIARLWRLGWPSSAQFVVRISAMLITHSLVARAFTSQDDQSATTALGIVFRLEMMALFVAVGWASAAQTFVGQNLGAKQDERAVRAGSLAATFAAVSLAALAIAYDRLGLPIVRFFDSDPRVVGVALEYLSIVAWSYVGLGAAVAFAGAMTGAQAMRATLLVDLVCVVLLQVPASVAVVLAPGASSARLWATVAGAYVAAGGVYLAVYVSRLWLRGRAAPP